MMKRSTQNVGYCFLLLLALMFLTASGASAQLVECEQINANGPPNVGDLAPGGCIARTLADQVDLGQTDTIGPGIGSYPLSAGSIFIIKHDPARAIRRGRQLFQRKFTADEGQGPRVNSSSTGDIRSARALGAGLADSCAACHGRPRGSAGFGGDVVTFPDSRDSPHLFGLGLMEQLGDEMTTDLRAIEAQAIADATSGGGGGTETPVDVDFDNGTDGFNYQDDTFNGTNSPAYAFGDRVFVGSDGILRVGLGNFDNVDIFGMSGGWQETFNVTSGGNATIEFNWRLFQSRDYESDEFSQAIIDVDGTTHVLGTFTGNGNGGAHQDTGELFASIALGNLGPGSHTVTLGGYNNKKTFADEFTEVFYNNVKITVASACPVTRSLDTKGVNFGSITVSCNGTVDYSNVEGVDAPSLRVKPFFAQGGTVSMREFLIGAFNAEMGLQAVDPILCAVTDPVSPVAMTSPAGFHYDPTLDTFERPPACDAAADPDGDGVANEIDTALVDYVEFYLLNYFKPGRYMQTARTNQGLALMEQIGCTSCHVKDLTINNDRRVADVETDFDPVNGIFNELFASASTLFFTQADPANPAYPFVLPNENSFVVENVFSDLKRHDLGPDFDERDFDGTLIREHITEPLWGVGSSPPYGHDGRSINLDAVIRRHGGEAASVTLAYGALSDDDQRKIHDFLGTLILFPPDDTASNLAGGGGDPNAPNFPQNGHGSINLGALFQVPSVDIGPE